MRTSSLLLLQLVLAGALCCGVCCGVQIIDQWKNVTSFKKGLEASGLAFIPASSPRQPLSASWAPYRKQRTVEPAGTLLVAVDSSLLCLVALPTNEQEAPCVELRTPKGNSIDLEAVTVDMAAWEQRGVIYLGQEVPPVIREYHLESGNFTRKIDVSDDFPTKHNRGMEALTFIPDEAAPYFIAGNQNDGMLYEFALPPYDGTYNVDPIFLRKWTPPVDNTYDIAGSYYAEWSKRFFITSDKLNVLFSFNVVTGMNVRQWSTVGPVENQEGVYLFPERGGNGTLFMADDAGALYRAEIHGIVPPSNNFSTALL